VSGQETTQLPVHKNIIDKKQTAGIVRLHLQFLILRDTNHVSWFLLAVHESKQSLPKEL
jgi:Mn-containing catalase